MFTKFQNISWIQKMFVICSHFWKILETLKKIKISKNNVHYFLNFPSKLLNHELRLGATVFLRAAVDRCSVALVALPACACWCYTIQNVSYRTTPPPRDSYSVRGCCRAPTLHALVVGWANPFHDFFFWFFLLFVRLFLFFSFLFSLPFLIIFLFSFYFIFPSLLFTFVYEFSFQIHKHFLFIEFKKCLSM